MHDFFFSASIFVAYLICIPNHLNLNHWLRQCNDLLKGNAQTEKKYIICKDSTLIFCNPSDICIINIHCFLHNKQNVGQTVLSQRRYLFSNERQGNIFSKDNTKNGFSRATTVSFIKIGTQHSRVHGNFFFPMKDHAFY